MEQRFIGEAAMNYLAYPFYEASLAMLSPALLSMQISASAFSQSLLGKVPGFANLASASQLLSCLRLKESAPGFGLNRVSLADRDGCEHVRIHEEAVYKAPFGSLLHFRKEGVSAGPRVLVVAPMAGHFASRMRETVRTLVTDHDVYVTDWHNARDVPLSAGRFDLDDAIQYLMDFLQKMGQGVHVLAVCQACVPALAAASIMAEDDHASQPRSLTLMAGPIDPRIRPTSVYRFANRAPLRWYQHNLISIVPANCAGAMRRVYPGFIQLAALMSMQPKQHIDAFLKMYQSQISGNWAVLEEIQAFYAEYLAMLDLTEEFYLSTLCRIFREAELAQGTFQWRGRLVRPQAIRRTSLLTVEGEHDEVCATGQTRAAHALCSGIPSDMKFQHVQPASGHDDVFSGVTWREGVYPRIRSLIMSCQQEDGLCGRANACAA